MPHKDAKRSYYVEPNPEKVDEMQYRLLENRATVGVVHTMEEVDAFLRGAPKEAAPKKAPSKRRFVDVTHTPVFLFNMSGFLNKFVASVAILCAAIFHALGSELVTFALDILVVCLCIGLVKALIWVALYAFGIEMETAEALKFKPRYQGR